MGGGGGIFGGGGGGCFVAGTQVLVPKPTAQTDDPYAVICIEDLQVGDDVISFDEELKLVLAKVTKVWKHEPREVITVKLWGNTYELTGTPEHFVYSQRVGAFERLDTADTLNNRWGGVLPVTRRVYHEEPQVVYNLTVEPNNTYIANQLLVHNLGGGGGGEKESSSYNPLLMPFLPLMEDAASQYQNLYGQYYWPSEEIGAQNLLRWMQQATPYDQRVQDYLLQRSDELLGVAAETNPLLDESRKDLIRRLIEGEDVLADRYRSAAAADTAGSFAQQRSQMQDRLSQLGINPNSGAAFSAFGSLGGQEALTTASALTQASRQAEDTSLERMASAQQMYTNPERILSDQQPGLSLSDILRAAGGAAQETTTSGGGGGGGGLGSILGAGINLATKLF